MKEINLQDLAANSQETLLVYAKDELGLNVPANIGKDKLIGKINEANGLIDENTFVDDADSIDEALDDDADIGDADIDDGVYNPNLKKHIPDVHARKDIKKVVINLQEMDGSTGGDDVIVGVQGKMWQIKRGVDVTVPVYVVEALKNAVETKYVEVEVDGQTVQKERKVMSYPFNIVGAA